MELTGWASKLGAILLAVLGWLALEFYQGIDSNNKEIALLRDRVAATEAIIRQVRQTQRDFMKIVLDIRIKPPGIQHPGVDHVE